MSSEEDLNFDLPPVVAGMKISGENSVIDDLVKNGILIPVDFSAGVKMPNARPQPRFGHIVNLPFIVSRAQRLIERIRLEEGRNDKEQ